MSNYFDMLRREDLPQNHGAQRSLSPAPEAPAARVCAGFALCLTVENNGEHIRSRVRCSLHGSVQCLQRVSTCFNAFQRARCFNTELFLRSLFVCDVSFNPFFLLRSAPGVAQVPWHGSAAVPSQVERHGVAAAAPGRAEAAKQLTCYKL